ncbi:hypothetical protein [Streptomyces sp. AC627_RSS907]|uniref:hypothetical protein n=1 Tax=Streptomyces sp. AC627_RSS907 TaxID=2823684 RepID=UPI001C24FD10|nr:hypothetical protein [Streptomyces sp. AC627_RSS907]
MPRDADRPQDRQSEALGPGQWAKAVLYNGLGRYEEAYAAAEQDAGEPPELGLAVRSMVELVEAAVRSGRPFRAAETARRLDVLARASHTDWALGTTAMVRAQVSEGTVADALYREAIERLGRTDVKSTYARSHLLYGEWLRRENRRADAREHLGVSHALLSRIGAESFAERAWHEMRAVGATVGRPFFRTRPSPSAREARIVRPAGEGTAGPGTGAGGAVREGTTVTA